MTNINEIEILSKQMQNTDGLQEFDLNEILESFNSIKTIDSAKAFLKEKFNVENVVRNLFIEKDCFMDTLEYPEFYMVEITRQKEHYIYCYKK